MRLRYSGGIILAVLTGVSNPVMKYLGSIVPIYVVSLLRGLIIITLSIRGSRKTVRTKMERDVKIRYIIIGVLATMGFFTYYPIINMVEIGIVSLFTVNLTMLLTMLFASIFLKEKLTITQWVLTLIGLITLGHLTYEAINLEFNWGYILLLFNSILNATIAIIVKHIIDTREANEITFYRTGIDIILSTLLIVATPQILITFFTNLKIIVIPLIIYLGFNSYIIGVISIKTTKDIGLVMTEILRSTSTVFTIAIGVLFLNETYNTSQYISLTIFIICIVSIVYI